jgi:hypothetical protein
MPLIRLIRNFMYLEEDEKNNRKDRKEGAESRKEFLLCGPLRQPELAEGLCVTLR